MRIDFCWWPDLIWNAWHHGGRDPKINQTHSSIVQWQKRERLWQKQKKNSGHTTVAQWERSVNTIPKLPMGYKSPMMELWYSCCWTFLVLTTFKNVWDFTQDFSYPLGLSNRETNFLTPSAVCFENKLKGLTSIKESMRSYRKLQPP